MKTMPNYYTFLTVTSPCFYTERKPNFCSISPNTFFFLYINTKHLKFLLWLETRGVRFSFLHSSLLGLMWPILSTICVNYQSFTRYPRVDSLLTLLVNEFHSTVIQFSLIRCVGEYLASASTDTTELPFDFWRWDARRKICVCLLYRRRVT